MTALRPLAEIGGGLGQHPGPPGKYVACGNPHSVAMFVFVWFFFGGGVEEMVHLSGTLLEVPWQNWAGDVFLLMSRPNP